MFRIKICGITNPADVAAAAEAGADAIGLNFCAASKRCIDLARAEKIIAVLPAHVAKVGVFADMQPAEMIEIAERLGLDMLQLHGRETPADLAMLGGHALIKAFGCGPSGHAAVLAYLADCQQAGARPGMVLLDAESAGQLGGTGRLADWPAARAYASEAGVPPLVLAGGLTAENVGEAIRAVRPAAVDTASGVERSPGLKDADKLARFVTAARAAFSEIERCP
ncbi:MAG TPA: phosphoribosylanthranilate isomerase [Pirellulales bacterium]